ncbi:hypothetical protein EBU02_10145, partial [bacterium]|nr:hypothetical protein [bacterium]
NTTERRGRREVEQPKVGPAGARRAGASESKSTESTEENQGLCIIRAHASNPWLVFPKNAPRKFFFQKL